MLVIAPLFPQLYNTNPASRELAKYFIMVTAVFMPAQAFLHAAYFTLRSGGKTIVTFFFDSVFICCVSVPIAYLLGHFTGLYVVYIFVAVQMADIIKCIIGFVLVKKRCVAAEYCRVRRKPILTICINRVSESVFYANLTFILEKHDS